MRRFVVVVVLAWLAYLPTVRHRNIGDCGGSSRMATVESLVERGGFAIDSSSFVYTCDLMEIDGKLYSDKPPVLSVGASAVYAVLHHLFGLSFDPASVPGKTPVHDHTYALMILLLIVTAQALLVGIFDLAAGEVGLTGRWRLVATVSLGFGTLLWPLAGLFNPHTIAALAIFVGLRAVLLRSSPSPLVGGLALGIAAVVDIPLGLLSLATGVLLARSRLRVALGAVAPLVCHALLNWWVVGDVIPFQLHRELYTEATGHTGLSATGFAQDAGLLFYLARNLVGALGVFSLTPMLVLALPLAIREAVRGENRRFAVAAIGLFTAAIALYTVVWPDAVGCTYGMRHLTPVTAPLLLVAAVGVIGSGRLLRKAYVGLALVSVLLAGVGIISPTTCAGFHQDARGLVPARVAVDNLRLLLDRSPLGGGE